MWADIMRITNVVMTGQLNADVDLSTFRARGTWRRLPRFGSALSWKLPQAPTKCLVFANGHISCAGADGMNTVRVYAKEFETMGYTVTELKRVTMSAVHQLDGRIRYTDIVQPLGVTYEPELFHAATLHRRGVYFTVFSTGKVCIVGIKDEKCMDNIVYPTLMELDLYTYT